MADHILGLSGSSHTLGRNWHERFIVRQPVISHKVSECIDQQRKNAATEENLRNWGETLSARFTELELKKENIHNVHEYSTLHGVWGNTTIIEAPRRDHLGRVKVRTSDTSLYWGKS